MLKRGGIAAIVLSLLAVAAWHGVDAAVQNEGRRPSTATVQTQSAADVGPVVHNGALRVSYADVVDRVSPGVVTVRVAGKVSPTPTRGQSQDLDELQRFFGRQFRIPMQPQQPRRTRGLGSGVVVSQDGYILTNNHVIDQADQIRVELKDRRTFDAKLIGADPQTDLAVLKINATGLPVVALGNSDRVRVGDVVLAFGNPLNVGQTVTMGIVSAKGRETGLGDGSFEDFLQTDAPINEGNSGGALVNANGELVGINSQILTPSGGNIGLGFAIPVNMAHSVMDQLVKGGKVQRGKLGVTVQRMNADLASSLGLSAVNGALVSNVEPGSAAARAGLKQGDVILDVDGRPVDDSNELRNAIAGTKPGTTVNLKITRDGRTETVKATLDELKGQQQETRGGGQGEDTETGKFGMTVQPLTSELADRLELPRGTRGLVIADVDPDGEAAAAGLRPGDVIQKVNGKELASGAELRAELSKATDKPALLIVSREGQTLFLTLRAPRS